MAPTRASRPLLPLLALALAVPLLPSHVQAADSTGPVELEYTLDTSDPGLRAQGKVQVTWKASNFQGRISAFCLQMDRHEYAHDRDTFGPLSTWQYKPTDIDPPGGKPDCSQGYRALVPSANEVSATFVLDVKKPAFTACGCEFNSFLGPEWGVVKGEAFAVPFSYAFFAPQPPFHATVRFILAPGMSAEAPWARLDVNRYELPGTGAPLPRGFFVVGTFAPEPRDERATIGKEFVYVRLAAELRSKDSMFEYLQAATPYYQSVYGNVTGERILVVSAGPPMFTGGLGSTDSLFVHQNSSAETIAHEYAHVWQRFQTIDLQGSSSLWVNEGDADLHGALSRFVTETQPGFNLAKLNAEFKESYDENSVKPEQQQPLTAATYGGPFEQVAYKKGLFTLLFLDQELRRLTNDSATLNDFLHEMNVYYDAVVSQRQGGEKRTSNQDVLDVVNRVVQRHANVDMRNFFDLYVFGATWPPYREVPAEVPIVLDKLEVEPAQATPGQSMTVRVQATNVRDSAQSRTVALMLDDVQVQQRSITVGALETVPVSFALAAPAPGAHTVRVGYLRQEFQVLTPGALVIEKVVPVGAPQAGVAFDLAVDLRNSGESAAKATVDATLGGLVRSAQVEVPGGGATRARLPFVVANETMVPAEVIVRWGDQTATASAIVTVGPRDRDGDGVPDKTDAFPDDPRLSEGGVVNDLRSKAPGFEAAAVVAGLAVVALAARRA